MIERFGFLGKGGGVILKCYAFLSRDHGSTASHEIGSAFWLVEHTTVPLLNPSTFVFILAACL